MSGRAGAASRARLGWSGRGRWEAWGRKERRSWSSIPPPKPPPTPVSPSTCQAPVSLPNAGVRFSFCSAAPREESKHPRLQWSASTSVSISPDLPFPILSTQPARRALPAPFCFSHDTACSARSQQSALLVLSLLAPSLGLSFSIHKMGGTSLAVQWLRLCASNAGSTGLVPCSGN